MGERGEVYSLYGVPGFAISSRYLTPETRWLQKWLQIPGQVELFVGGSGLTGTSCSASPAPVAR
jgi:hypothetical protein